MNDKKIIFDVGANNGLSFREAAREGHSVYAFEPTPELIKFIKKWLAKDPLENYILLECAVSNISGMVNFNVKGRGDWGCSSLNEVQDNINELWPGPSFETTKKITVPCITLESFIDVLGLNKIDYLHIDTQGSDLDVLKSLGKHTNMVVEGVMETSNTVKIYKNTPSKEECISWLYSNNFYITDIVNDGNAGQEQNIYFRNKNYEPKNRPWVYSGISHFKYPDSCYEPFFL